MGKIAKAPRRAMKRVTQAWRQALVENSPQWMKATFGPAASRFEMLFADHGVFRLVYLNRHRLDSQAWRAAQPAPRQIAAIARQGIRTIVNLRGASNSSSYWLEKDACERYGIALVNFQVRSRAAPTREELFGARDLFERIEYPMLMHCKSGADRAGLMSVLYRHLRCGQPIEQARHQLSLRYGHIRQADTGILDYFFERYLADNQRQPMAFFEWVERVYDPDELRATFHASTWANRLVNSVLKRE